MQRTIELKHVGPRTHVRGLLNELVDRLAAKLHRNDSPATSVHVVFEENGAHKVFRASVTCHLPGRLVAAHEEDREAGRAIHRAFHEVTHQVQRYCDRRQRQPARRTAAGRRT